MNQEQVAKVLAGHVLSHSNWDDSEIAVTCGCGVEIVGQDDGDEAYVQEERLFAGHLAAVLAPLLVAAKAEAWDQGQKSGIRHADRMIAAHSIGRLDLPGPISPNPYRTT